VFFLGIPVVASVAVVIVAMKSSVLIRFMYRARVVNGSGVLEG